MARPAPGADRSVAVLELLAGNPDERFTLSEVARRCQLNKATAHALLSALSSRGVLLRHPEEKRYSLGPRLISIGDAARRGYTAVDFVQPVLDELAKTTGLWARAWRVQGDHVACVADAGVPDALAGVVRARLPLVPPVGSVFMAWTDSPTVEAWLARAPASEAVPPALATLPTVRDRRYSVTLTSPEWRVLSGSTVPDGTDADPDVAASTQRALLVAVARQALLVGKLEDELTYRLGEVAAPVFGCEGTVELAVALTAPTDDDVSGAQVEVLGNQLVQAADVLTAAVRGRLP